MISREEAFNLVSTWTENKNLIKHMLAVESAMEGLANYFKEDINLWKIAGLLHDADYDKYPEEHCKVTEQILKEEGWPDDYIRGVMSHGWKICTDVEAIEIMGLFKRCPPIEP